MLAKSISGAAAAASPAYIEDVFSTYLYTGNGSTQTITNGIDLSGKGGLVWIKSRTEGGTNYNGYPTFFDTERGATQGLFSSSTVGQSAYTTALTSFNSSGFSLGDRDFSNYSGHSFTSWTFRKAPKFFDVVTYTGNGANRTIAHNLGSVPGCIIVKRTDTTADWQVYHRSLANTEYLVLNAIAAKDTGTTRWNSTTPTSTVFSLGTDATVNANGGTYVAYLFAHNAGGFGLTGTDNVISCGTYTGTGSDGNEITLGYEPQLLILKTSDPNAGSWRILDIMRGLDLSLSDSVLFANFSSEESVSSHASPTATGFVPAGTSNNATVAYIYIAIRRGPMKVPTSGTSVFGLNARSGTGANATVTGGQVDDAILIKNRGSAVGDLFAARLTGTSYLETSSTAAEVATGTTILQTNPWDVMDGVKVGTTSTITNASGNTFINYLFRRAPGFFDVVAYTGTGVARTVPHNLAAVPEMIILKRRNANENWVVSSTAINFASNTGYLFLNSSSAIGAAGSREYFGLTSPTSSVFYVGNTSATNGNTDTFIAYLFATCPGVSKVGSYTGTGTTKQIDCGFTGGARFVLIKRTDSTGDWYVWDTARGIVAGNDPYLLLNSNAAEVTNTDYIDTYSAGFEISSTAPAAINANGGTFIFLAIA